MFGRILNCASSFSGSKYAASQQSPQIGSKKKVHLSARTDGANRLGILLQEVPTEAQ